MGPISEYIIRTIVLAGVYIVLAIGLNLIVGYTGQLSMGHVAFFCIGAYTSALLSIRLNVSPWLGILAGMCMAGVASLLLSLPALRVRSDYLAIVTLAFGELTRLGMVNWIAVTRGPMGLPGIKPYSIFGFSIRSITGNYYICLALVLIAVVLVRRLIHSPFGRAMMAIRGDETAAEAMGVNVSLVKILVFTMGGLLAGMIGAFFAHFNGFISPENFTYNESVTILLMLVLGGIGSLRGAVAGAVVLTILPEALRGLGQWRMVIYGLLMIVIILLRPQGFFGKSVEGNQSILKLILRGNKNVAGST
jgi:branched-chain amino acid transport system permease protein